MADQASQDQGGQPAAAPAGRKNRRGYAGQAYEFGAASTLQQQAPGGQPAPNYDTYAYPSENHGYSQGGFAAPAVGNDQQPQYGQAPGANLGGYQPPAPGYQAGMGGITQGMSNMTMGGGQAPAAAPVSIGGQQQKMVLNPLHTTDLMNQPFQPSELDFPPPSIILPPNTSVTPSPHANATPRYMRSTINAVPTTSSLLKKSKLPFALVLQPFGSLHDSEDNIPVAQDQVIARCRRCRTYINPFVTFLDQGHKWKCNVCGLPNDVPQAFDWDAAAQKQLDRWNRYELNYGVTEFVAPQEYLVRPPQPLIYFFLFDVSYAAVSSGLLATSARCLAESLDRIPNADRRTRLGFLAVDSSLHYFTVPRDGSPHNDASMLVVSDLDEPFLPTPNDLLVTLSEARENIEQFLGKLQGMFQNTQTSGSAMGPAMKAAHKVIAPMGGKITVLTASLPNIGDGKLEVRENKNVLGTSKEASLLQTGSAFYKSFAVECSKNQVCIDMFLFSSSYQDVASLSNLPRYTGGQTWTYPGWNAARPEDAIKFASEFSNYLSMEVGLEAVLRVRATTGLRMNAFHGNFFYRSSDLCSYPSHPRDQAYVIEVAIDETLAKNVVYLQAGILYTTCNSERRVRVITLALPTTQIMADVYASADPGAITTYYSHKAVERVFNNGLDAARDALQTKAIEILQTFRKEVGSGAGGLSCPANLRSLPVLFLGLIKNVGLRKSAQIPSDIRSAALCLLSTLPIPLLLQFMYPRMYSLHDMPDDAGLADEKSGQIVMPPTVPASSASLVPHGLYLIDDGQTQFLWLGRDAVPQLLDDVFGIADKNQLRVGKMTMPEVDNDFNTRVRAVIEKSKDHLSRGMGSITVPFLYLVREDGEPSLRLWAQSLLVEDRSDAAPSLKQWLGMIREKSVQ